MLRVLYYNFFVIFILFCKIFILENNASDIDISVSSGNVVLELPDESIPDETDLIPWEQKQYHQIAKGSVGNSGEWLLDPPAGKHGWVKVRNDGRLEFEDGTAARFWGTTLTYAGTFPDKEEEIELLADLIASCGYNLVRFHHNDIPRIGLGYLKSKTDNSPASSIELSSEGMDRFDKLAAALVKRGIYLYLDIVDSRPWTADTGMLDWEELAKVHNQAGWKGVWPHPVMIDAWKKAASALLSHTNPYTGKKWGNDPAVVMIEALNENGPFWDWGFTVTDKIRKWHDTDWNLWLLEKYKSRENLAKAWTDAMGKCGLHDDEDPILATVFRPPLGTLTTWDRPNISKVRGACRVNDFYLYLAERTRFLHKITSSHIRSFGYKGLITGSHELRGPVNQLAELSATGTISAHLYAHSDLTWGIRPGINGITIEGVDVRSNNWYVNLPRIKVAGYPSWNAEWTGASWTRRADVNIAVAVAHAFQKVDGGVQFGFVQRWVGEAMPEFDWTYKYIHWRKRIAQSFTSGLDPTWRIANCFASAMVLRGDIPKSKYKVHIALSDEDVHEQNLHAAGINGGSGTVGGASLFIPLIHEVETKFFKDVYDGDADIVFTTGRSASGDYSKAKHAFILGDNPWCDRYHKKRDLALPARLIHKTIKTQELENVVFTIMWPYDIPQKVKIKALEAAVDIRTIPVDAIPIGVSEDKKWTLGWYNKRFVVLPNAAIYGESLSDPRWLYQLYISAMKYWGLELYSELNSTEYKTDNNCIINDWGTGTQIIDTPKTQIISGFAGFRKTNITSNMSLKVNNPYAVVAITSTNDKTISKSERLLLAAIGRVVNTGTKIINRNGKSELIDTGKKPTLVECLRGELQLKGLSFANTMQVFALDSEGRRLGEVPIKRENNNITLNLSPSWKTIWFEVCKEGIKAPASLSSSIWPLTSSQPTVVLKKPKSFLLKEYLAFLTDRQNKVDSEDENNERLLNNNKVFGIDLTKITEWKPYQAYGNLKVERNILEDGTDVLKFDIGKYTKYWHAGAWWNVTPPQGLKSENILALSFGFKGDGTMPRETYITIKTKDGKSYRSKNISSIFEDSSWRRIILKTDDFIQDKTDTNLPDFSTISRIDFSCVGPLMESKNLGILGNFQLLVSADIRKIEEPFKNLPDARLLENPKIEIPYLKESIINIDGVASENEWLSAVGIKMDEENIPSWHKIGSYLVEGDRKHGEKAFFWLLATEKGLCVFVIVEKGSNEIFIHPTNWYLGDCVELFIDVDAKRKKPSKQIFLAYKQYNLDQPASNAKGVLIGRALTNNGYTLEAMIPWKELGFESIPLEFAMDFQVDFGNSEGRYLQLTYATGTNEAWISSERYIITVLKP